MTAPNPDLVRQWLEILHGGAPGHTHICSKDDWAGRTFADLDAATNYVRYLDGEGRESIYARITTLPATRCPTNHPNRTERRACKRGWHDQRGGADDSLTLPALWADLDLAGPGHEHDPAKYEGRELPPDETAGRAIIAATGLPEPTLWIHSGGGLYPIWLFDKPHEITDDNLDDLKELAAGWQHIIGHAAARLGWHYGTGVGDLARVLRVPGTVNRKEGLARPCRILPDGATGTQYSLAQLREAYAQASAPLATPAAEPAPARMSSLLDEFGVRPGDDFNARFDWATLIEQAGGREHYQKDPATYWTRPGKTTDISASTNALGTDQLHVFTTNWPPFEGGQSYSKFAAYTLLRYGNLTTQAFKQATDQLAQDGFGVRRDWPTEARRGIDFLLSQLPRATPQPAAQQTAMPPEPAPAPPSAQIAAAGGGKYFTDKGAFLAATLATDILNPNLGNGPLTVGADDLVWSYRDGVWSPDKRAVRERAVHLLGERYRNEHAGNAESIVRASVDHLDCDPVPDLINFRNGLLDWRTDQLRAHSPDVPSTVQLPHDWTPGALCPRFDAFLTEIVPADMTATVWELIGYLMYSGNPLHKAVMLMGKGRNGKGTLIRLVVALLGKRNVTAIALHDLVTNRFAKATLFGKIANIAGDIDATYLESTAVFKAITGQDQISAEHKNRDFFDFTPWAVPVFSANEIPPSADTTTGYLSRWLTIPFPADFSGQEDRNLQAKLNAEIPGIAAKAIPALRRLMDRGDFETTESGRAAYEDFMRRVDQVRTWIGDCCDIAPGPHEANAHPFIPRAELYRAYKDWCARDGHKALAASKFYDRLGAAGATPISLNGTRGFRGLRIVDSAGALSGLTPAPISAPWPVR